MFHFHLIPIRCQACPSPFPETTRWPHHWSNGETCWLQSYHHHHHPSCVWLPWNLVTMNTDCLQNLKRTLLRHSAGVEGGGQSRAGSGKQANPSSSLSSVIKYSTFQNIEKVPELIKLWLLLTWRKKVSLLYSTSVKPHELTHVHGYRQKSSCAPVTLRSSLPGICAAVGLLPRCL